MMISLFLAIAATSTAAQPACAPVTLAVGSKVLVRSLGPKSADLRRLNANFAKAYRQSCSAGLFRARPLIPTNGANAGKLFLVNAPNANVASIRPGPARMEFEFPFVTGRTRPNLPSADEIKEAIYCAVAFPSESDREAGRCLPD